MIIFQKIIHKDNKLIPAMVLSVKELLEMSITLDNSQLKDMSELKAKAMKLLEELEDISKERKRHYDRDRTAFI